MTYNDFTATLTHETPPAALPPLLKALWYDKKGDWHRAHEIAQEANSKDHCLIHAYLHRKEGDIPNARYWYNRAGTSLPNTPLDAEWEAMVREWVTQK